MVIQENFVKRVKFTSMKKVIMFLLLAVIMASMSAVFTSCSSSDDESERVEIDQYERIKGLWQYVSKSEGEIVSSDLVYEFKFNHDRTGYWRLYLTLNGRIIKEQKREFTYTFTGEKLTLRDSETSSITEYSSHLSNNTLTISNEENGKFVLKRAE